MPVTGIRLPVGTGSATAHVPQPSIAGGHQGICGAVSIRSVRWSSLLAQSTLYCGGRSAPEFVLVTPSVHKEL